MHARHIYRHGQRLGRTELEASTQRVAKRAFEEFADVSEVLQHQNDMV